MEASGEAAVLLTACGAAAPAPGVVDRMARHADREVEIGGYDAEGEVADELAEARKRVARLMGLGPGNLSLTASGTSSTVSLFQAMLAGGNDLAGRLIVTDPREFGSNLTLLRRLAGESGASVELLAVTPEGRLDLDQLGQLVASGRVGLVWLSLAHAYAGQTNPVDDIAPALSGRPDHTWLVAWVCPRRLDELDPWPEPTAPPLGVLERHEGPTAAKLGFGVALAHFDSVGVQATHEALAERARWLRGEFVGLQSWRTIDDPTTASAKVSLAPTGPIETHLDTVAQAKESLTERGVRVTVTHRHHAPGAMEALKAGAALRLGPHADQRWDELQRAAEVVTQVVASRVGISAPAPGLASPSLHQQRDE